MTDFNNNFPLAAYKLNLDQMITENQTAISHYGNVIAMAGNITGYNDLTANIATEHQAMCETLETKNVIYNQMNDEIDNVLALSSGDQQSLFDLWSASLFEAQQSYMARLLEHSGNLISESSGLLTDGSLSSEEKRYLARAVCVKYVPTPPRTEFFTTGHCL